MIAVIDLGAELAKLAMLDGRHPRTTEAEKNGAIAKLAPYRGSAIFAPTGSRKSNDHQLS